MKSPFLDVEFLSTVRLTPSETRTLKRVLGTASQVFEDLVRDNVIKGKLRSKKCYRVSLLICGDGRIRELNREFRNKDKVTDVLSFPAYDDLRMTPPEEDDIHLGDLAISFPQTKRQAKEFSIGTWDEFIHLFFHGLLHLLGYDHEVSAVEEKMMQGWEDRALTQFSAKKRGP